MVKRIPEITTLQSIGILLVVLGHSIISEANNTTYIQFFTKYIYSFHMPLFMVISGYLFAYNEVLYSKRAIGYLEFLCKKLKRLIYPYVVLSSLAFIPKVALSSYAKRPVQFGWSEYLKNILYPWDNVIVFFWYLPTLFIIMCISPIFIYILLRQQKLIIPLTITLILAHIYNPVTHIKFLNISGVINYLIFFWIGCLIAINYEKYKEYCTGSTIFLLTIIISIILNIYVYDNKALEFIIALIGICMTFNYSYFYNQMSCKFLSYIDGYSFQIFLLSWFFQIFVKIILFQIFFINIYITSIFMFLGGLIPPVLLSKYLSNKKMRFKILLGM